MVRNALADPYAETELWWEPIQLDSSNVDGPVLTEAQVQQWLRDVRPHPTLLAGRWASGALLTLGCARAQGFLPVTGLWPEELIERAVAEVHALHPPEEVAKAGRGFSEQPWLHAPPVGFNEVTRPEDKAPEMALNHMTIEPRALAACSQLMDTPQENIRLSQSAAPLALCPRCAAAG